MAPNCNTTRGSRGRNFPSHPACGSGSGTRIDDHVRGLYEENWHGRIKCFHIYRWDRETRYAFFTSLIWSILFAWNKWSYVQNWDLSKGVWPIYIQWDYIATMDQTRGSRNILREFTVCLRRSLQCESMWAAEAEQLRNTCQFGTFLVRHWFGVGVPVIQGSWGARLNIDDNDNTVDVMLLDPILLEKNNLFANYALYFFAHRRQWV